MPQAMAMIGLAEIAGVSWWMWRLDFAIKIIAVYAQ
jgi:hypothetical protein